MATDANLRFLGHQVIGFQLARAFTTDTGGPSREGSATYLWYEWQGRHLRIFANDQRMAPDYANALAFVRRTGFRVNSANLGWEFQPAQAGSWFVKARPFVVIRRLVTSADAVDESYVDPGLDITLPRDVTFYVYHSFHTDSFAGRRFGYDFNVFFYTIKTFKRVVLAGRLQLGEGVSIGPASPAIGRNVDSRVTLTLKPHAAPTSELLWLKSRLRENGTGRTLFEQDIWRSRTNLQLTRSHGLRGIAEWNTRTRRIGLSFLYSYAPRANTALYAGYGDVLEEPTEDRHDAPTTPVRRFERVSRTLFLKLSYGVRP